ncbi:hypothetical protein [Terrabacter sp. RAF57]|uniref:hypothetical protein n=1 Tax=Terrabacter sp. RAF57 TaxID=3233063 RepID=UPI003F9E5EC8
MVVATSKVISGPGALARLIATLPKKAKLTAAIAYITDPTGLELKAGDRIYVNCLDATIASGGTDPRVLEKWARAGVEVLHCEELHAKVVVAGRWTAIGSTNLSQRANRVQEALWIGTDPETRNQALTFLNSLADVSVEVDAPWLRAKRGLFGTARTGGGGARRRSDHERRPHSVLPVKCRRRSKTRPFRRSKTRPPVCRF